jgi:hypothetical protein
VRVEIDAPDDKQRLVGETCDSLQWRFNWLSVLDEVLLKVAGDLLIAGLRRFVARIRMYGDQLCFGPHSQSLCRLDLM